MSATRRPRGRAAGFTLLELLVVIFLLAAVAATATSVVDGLDQQARHDDTQARLEQVRAAIVGRPDRDVNGRPAPGGFVADVGRLPASLDELLQRPVGVAPFTVDPASGIPAGWRGPYLYAPSGAFPDGWGNPGGAPDHGWYRPDAADPAYDPTAFQLRSKGADGLTDAAGGGAGSYDRDQPAGRSLVLASDCLVDLTGWQVEVTLSKATAGDRTVTARLRLLHPRDGSLSWPAPWPTTGLADLDWLSDGQTVTLTDATPAATVTFSFPAPADGSRPVPWGQRALVVVNEADGAPLGAGPARPVLLLPRSAPPLGLTFTWSVD